MMATPEDIKEWIEQNLAESEVEISGDGRHFDAVIVCAGFAGKTESSNTRWCMPRLATE